MSAVRFRSLPLRALCVASAALALNSAHATNWVATQTHALPLRATLPVQAMPASAPLRITVALRLRNDAALDQLIAAQHTPGSPAYGMTLTPAQFAANYSPSAAQAQAVADYLTQNGFRNVRIAANRVLVSGEASAASVQAAFNTRIVSFRAGGTKAFAPVVDVMVPDFLGDTVLSVLGVQYLPNRHVATTHRFAADEIRRGIVSPAANGVPAVIDSYTPDQTRIAYNANPAPTGAGTVVAISSSNSDLSQVVKDLRQYENEYHLPQVPVSIQNFGPLDKIDPNADGEWDLDAQSSTGIAGNVKELRFYNAEDLNDEPTMLQAINQFAIDNVARIGNMSYGGCEDPEIITGAETAFDQAYKQAVAQGQTWFASSGDAGAACTVLINIVTPDFGIPSHIELPAGSPYVVAVGGTSLFVNADNSYDAEITWDAGGGGTSFYLKAPAWQAKDKAVTTAFATGLRAVPDISMVAGGPDVGTPVGYVGQGSAAIVYNGADAGAIGTSWSSPLAAGAYARMQSAHCNTLGFAAPLFYALDTAQQPGSTASGFHDIVIGNNGQWNALPGWDNTNGYGTFDVAAVNAALPPKPADCVTTVAPPVAQLAATGLLGPAPLDVVFDGAGSSDPAGLALTTYALDFGDGSTANQSTPVFPPHTYAQAGTYVARLTVSNAKGGVSNVVAQTVTAFGTPQACAAGGQQMLTSPPGSAQLQAGVDIGQGTDDLLYTSIGEPGDLANRLVFTIKVATLASPKPGFRWLTYFDVRGRTNPNDTYYWVAMSTADGAAPAFVYGVHGYVPGPQPVSTFTQLGKLDAASHYNADGTITLTLDKAAFNLHTGDVLTNVFTSIRTQTPDDPTGTLPGGAGLTQDSAGTATPYTVVGNATCAPNTAPVARLVASVTSGVAPLPVNLDAASSSDAEDSVAYYRFDFGDGSASAWQTAPSAQHVYAAVGHFAPSVSVADARGLQSIDIASTGVTVDVPLIAVDDRYMVKTGSTAVTLRPLANDRSPGASALIATVGAPDKGGTVSVSSDGASLIYTPRPTLRGLEVFTYTIGDGYGHNASAQVTVAVWPNRAPVARADAFTLVKNSPAKGLIVLTNDTDADRRDSPPEVLKVTAVTLPDHHGRAVVSVDGGHVNYKPATNFVGTETFNYTVTDASGAASTALITVTVQ